MKEKNSKRVVIIDEIDSSTIEQAIFILRNNGTAVKPEKRTIVTEAERIINAYVQTIERTQLGINRRETRSRKKNPGRRGRKSGSAWVALACFLAAAGLILYCTGIPVGI